MTADGVLLKAEGLGKSFGAVRVLSRRQFRGSSRRGPGHPRPERGRQDDAVQPGQRRRRSSIEAAWFSRDSGSMREPPYRRCQHGDRTDLPNPPALRQHDDVREPPRRGVLRRRAIRGRKLRTLRRDPAGLRSVRQGQPLRGLADAARPQAPRTRARARFQSQAPAARRDRRRIDRRRGPGLGRPYQAHPRSAA